ncbi:MAG: tellurite resistance TerB C-terminal domain-containing protein, partial [Atopobiaceae bacterium]|nr:tellurite resistance TerB C-terminal domain-containing protein [Atopobiaceae bacterium]
LDGKDYTAIVSATPATLDMLIDSMNEKLFDLEGDVCFEFSDDGPVPIEDYAEDLRKALVHE